MELNSLCLISTVLFNSDDNGNDSKNGNGSQNGGGNDQVRKGVYASAAKKKDRAQNGM